MISPELELSDLDARHWRNGWRLLVPPRVLDAPSWALVVIDGGLERTVSIVIAGANDAPTTVDDTTGTTDTEAKKRATRRFEPGDADVVAPAGADDFGTGGAGKSPPPPPPSGKPAPAADEGDDFMTRMKKARDRGRRGPEDK